MNTIGVNKSCKKAEKQGQLPLRRPGPFNDWLFNLSNETAHAHCNGWLIGCIARCGVQYFVQKLSSVKFVKKKKIRCNRKGKDPLTIFDNGFSNRFDKKNLKN
jgi:hypothetical protein